MVQSALGSSIFVATIILVMVRPWRISEGIIACIGALLMVTLGFVMPGEALQILASQWNVFGFFLGLMLISAIADSAGFFDALALGAARIAGGNTQRLYLAVFAVGVLITAFLSNDATALILTPVIYTLATRLRLSILPFMFACTFIADTASFLLPVSNPINILVGTAFSVGLGPFLRHLLLPSLFCIIVNVGIFFWYFRNQLAGTYDLAAVEQALPPPSHRPFFRFVIGSLVVIAVSYMLASTLLLPLSFVALAGSLLLLAGAAWYRQINWRKIGSEVSWSIFLFIGGMFVLIRGIENLSITQAFGALLLGIAGQSTFGIIASIAIGTALGANVVNNVPMTLIMVSAIQSQHGLAGTLQAGAAYAVIFGADLGPNLTTVGSLATILWLLILRRKGLDISTTAYLKLGLLVVPIMLLGGIMLIWLSL